MKKLLAVFLIVALAVTMAACGGGNSDLPQTSDETNIESNLGTTGDDSGNATENNEEATNKIGSDFKEAMDSYETFMNDYVEFMKKYQAKPTDLNLLSDYTDYMSKYTKFVSDFEKWENDDLNTEELAYYLDVQTRVTKKLLEVAQ